MNRQNSAFPHFRISVIKFLVPLIVIFSILCACDDSATNNLNEETADEFESKMLQIDNESIESGTVDYIIETRDGSYKISNTRNNEDGECVGYYFNDPEIFKDNLNKTEELFTEYGLDFEEESGDEESSADEVSSTEEDYENKKVAQNLSDYTRPGPDSDNKHAVLIRDGKNVPWPFKKMSTWFYSATTKFNPSSYMYPSGANYGLYLRAKVRLKIDDRRFDDENEALINVSEIHCKLKGSKSKKSCWSTHWITIYRVPVWWLSNTGSFSDSDIKN